MPTVFLAPRKKNRKSRRPSFPASPPRVKTRPEPRHCRSTTGLAARFRPGWAVVALTLIMYSLTIPCGVNADLISETRARNLPPGATGQELPKTSPINRLRDTVVQLDVQWPTAPDRPFEKDASVPLEAMTQDPDPDTRVQGLLGLADANSPNTVRMLVFALDDPAPQVRQTALQKLAILDPGQLVRELVVRLDSPDEALRVSLEETLPALKEHLERPVLALLRAAETAPETRVVAARALGLMGSERAVPELSSVAFETADARLRLAATQALTLIASPEGLPALQGLSLHSSPQVRAEALVGLARIGGPLALSSIEAMALNPREDNARIRREAIAYIGLLGADPSIDTLISVMNRYPQTREEVVAALRRLTGLNLGNSPLEWTQWRYKQQKALEEAQKQEAPSGGVLGIIPAGGAPQAPPPQ